MRFLCIAQLFLWGAIFCEVGGNVPKIFEFVTVDERIRPPIIDPPILPMDPSCRATLCPHNHKCVMKNEWPRCVKSQVAVCEASGDPHIRTLDNRNYDFMGTCTYTFATVCGDVGNLPRFTIKMKLENRGSTHVSYVGEVILEIGPHTVVAKRGEFGFVRVDNVLCQPPIVLMNNLVKLFQSGNSILMQLGDEVLISFDWDHFLRMEVSSGYSGKMCGMCGNYNQDPNDDFQTPAGILVPDAVAFGTSWKVADNTFCWDDCRGPCLSCPKTSFDKFSAVNYCGLINQKGGPLSGCHDIMNPDMYMKNCAFDVCLNDGLKIFFCKAVQAYAETCQRSGASIKDWRTAAGCPLQCPKDSSYIFCGRACPATCEDPEAKTVCTLPCIETCQCNPGFVLSGGKCIPKAGCGCSYNGFTYAANEAFWKDNACKERCVCNGKTQKVECTDSPCKAEEECAVRKGIRNCYPRSYGVCSASSDPHIITFDGTAFDFQGTCVYQFTALCDQSLGLTPFEVWVRHQNLGVGGVSFPTAVYIKAYGLEIEASRQHPNKVKINNILKNLPYSSGDGRLSFYQDPSSVMLSLDFGLKVTYNYHNIVRVNVPSTYVNALCGLCGNYNGVAGDDLIPKGGSTPTDPMTFGMSWKVLEVFRCRDDGSAVCNDLAAEEKRQIEFTSECGVLLDNEGPFRDCLPRINAKPYWKSCVYDYCILQKRQTVYCSMITSYAMACQEAGLTVYPWRSEKYCPLSCPAHSSYEVCADPCPVTCNGLSTPKGCDGNCTEGCVCNNGFILSGGQCVPISECGCSHNGAYYTVGESVYDDNSCSQRCSCTEGGIMTCVSSACSRTEECRIENGVRGCFPRGSATCTAAGYSRYRTFDNYPYNFAGQCSYVLAETYGENTDLIEFRVTVQHERRDSIPGPIRSITIQAHETTLTLNQQEKGVIQVNGETSRLPVTLMAGKIRAEISGQGVNIILHWGILVKFNFDSLVSVTVPSNYMNAVRGLCGNYNGIAEDDVGKTPEEITAFGNKWNLGGEADNTCDGCGGKDNPCPTCLEEKKRIFLQPYSCGIISDPSGPFAKCHSQVNPESYENSCVSDLCLTNGEVYSVLCNSVSVYAAACKKAGVKDITWRNEKFCPVTCGANSHYTICADKCSTSCASISDPYPCSDQCEEGCECDEGYLSDGENCVSLDQCGCFDKGRYYQLNESVQSEDCSQVCTCDQTLGMTCQDLFCRRGSICQIRNGVRTCVGFIPRPFPPIVDLPRLERTG